jgi:hypothetical protein
MVVRIGRRVRRHKKITERLRFVSTTSTNTLLFLQVLIVDAAKRVVHASLSGAPGIPLVFTWRVTRPAVKRNTTSCTTTAQRVNSHSVRLVRLMEVRLWCTLVLRQLGQERINLAQTNSVRPPSVRNVMNRRYVSLTMKLKHRVLSTAVVVVIVVVAVRITNSHNYLLNRFSFYDLTPILLTGLGFPNP